MSKANYWAVPLGLGVASLGYWPRGVLLSPAGAGGIVALPYAWAVLHPAESLASVSKFYQAEPVLWPWVRGLGQLAGNLVAGLILALLIGGALWVTARPGPMPVATRILLRAAVLNLLLAVVLVVTVGATKIQARWLVPVFVMGTAAGFGWLAPALTRRAFRAVPTAAVVCALLTVVGMVHLRLAPGNTATLDFRPALDMVNRIDPPRLMGDYFTAGNLRLLAPERRIGPLEEIGDAGVLILGALPQLPQGMVVQESGAIPLKYAGATDRRFSLQYHMVVQQIKN